MVGKGLQRVGRRGMPSPRPDPEVVRAWVDASCADAGLAVKIVDGGVVVQVAALLGVVAPPAGGHPRRAVSVTASRRG
jgi:hypothetical protein